MTVAMITHEVPGDSFWDLIRKGAQAAADKDNIELRYSNDPEAPNQANLVQSAIDSKVDGIALTLAKPDAMAPAVKAADRTQASRSWPSTPASTTSRRWACRSTSARTRSWPASPPARSSTPTAPRRSSASSRSRARSHSNHVAPASSRASRARCEILNVNSKDMPSVEATITAKLQQDPSIDHVVALGAPIALTAVQSVGNADSSAKIVTFDTNAALVDAIKDGKVQWAVDQQPFLQGYLAIDSLWLFMNNKNLIGGGQPTLTGPSFIDQGNIDAVAELAKAGTR